MFLILLLYGWFCSACKYHILDFDDGCVLNKTQLGVHFQHSNPLHIPLQLKDGMSSLEDSDIIMINAGCKYVNEVHDMHVAWGEMKPFWKELSQTLKNYLTDEMLQRKTIVGFVSHPLVTYCIATPNYVMVRTDPLHDCNHSPSFTIPYYSPTPTTLLSHSSREHFVSLTGQCSNVTSFGKRVRWAICDRLKNISDVHCYCYGINAPPVSYGETRKTYARSIFCLLPPGDTLSTRRLSDIILSGCIPVFIGSRRFFSVAALSEIVDYSTFALFFDIEELETLYPADRLNDMNLINGGRFSFGNIPPDLIQRVKTIEDVNLELRKLTIYDQERLLKGLSSVQSSFAVDGLLPSIVRDRVCSLSQSSNLPITTII